MGFSCITVFLTKLTKKNTKSEWTNECNINFYELKQRLAAAPLLTISSYSSTGTIIYGDAL